ncbi:hypothetical protein M2351_008277 [Azospirillum canadense]|nr:hypothetical protein [Azospirillum canadense]
MTACAAKEGAAHSTFSANEPSHGA